MTPEPMAPLPGHNPESWTRESKAPSGGSFFEHREQSPADQSLEDSLAGAMFRETLPPGARPCRLPGLGADSLRAIWVGGGLGACQQPRVTRWGGHRQRPTRRKHRCG